MKFYGTSLKCPINFSIHKKNLRNIHQGERNNFSHSLLSTDTQKWNWNIYCVNYDFLAAFPYRSEWEVRKNLMNFFPSRWNTMTNWMKNVWRGISSQKFLHLSITSRVEKLWKNLFENWRDWSKNSYYENECKFFSFLTYRDDSFSLAALRVIITYQKKSRFCRRRKRW